MNDELVIYNKPKSSISENIRTIRTNLEFMNTTKKFKTILFTKKVLLIDADIRKGRLHLLFNVPSGANGLTNLLVDEDALESYKTIKDEYIVQTKIDNLSFLPRGSAVPNPSELLESPNAVKLIALFKLKYDYIIFDCCPVIGLPDALILARKMDKTIIVCSIGHTPSDVLENAKKSLENVDANIAGVVVNRVPSSNNDYYSKYYE